MGGCVAEACGWPRGITNNIDLASGASSSSIPQTRFTRSWICFAESRLVFSLGASLEMNVYMQDLPRARPAVQRRALRTLARSPRAQSCSAASRTCVLTAARRPTRQEAGPAHGFLPGGRIHGIGGRSEVWRWLNAEFMHVLHANELLMIAHAGRTSSHRWASYTCTVYVTLGVRGDCMHIHVYCSLSVGTSNGNCSLTVMSLPHSCLN